MIADAKSWAKRHWPRLRLRTIVFATLFAVAALPGVAAMFLRVYENTLVRQTEAELVAQGAALAAAAAVGWPGAEQASDRSAARAEPPTIDLSTTPVLPERPAGTGPPTTPAPDALAARRWLAPIATRTQATTLAGVVLLDRTGRVTSGPGAGSSLAMLPEVQTALTGRPATVLRRNGGYRATYRFEWLSRAAALRVHHARPIVVGERVVGVLLLSRSARALFRGLYEDRGKIVLGIVAILALLVILSGVLSRGVTRPIEQLGVATRAVASGRGHVPAPPATAAIEVQGLYADFAAMAAAIERRSRYLRDFAHAVSHEFKTPLAGIRGAIELLQDHPDMAAADRRRFLANADADVGRLALLVTGLLELARADMESPSAAVADPAAVMERVAATWRARGLAVVTPDAPVPAVAAPAATLERVLSTLMENSRQAGADTVTVTARVVDTTLVMEVADNGPGIAPGDRERLFEPFFTTRRATGGTGLGLPIARSLMEVAGGTLTLGDGAATVFALAVPVAR